MKLINIYILAVAAALLALSGCNRGKSTERESKEVTTQVIKNNIEQPTSNEIRPKEQIPTLVATLEPASSVTEISIKTPHINDVINKKTAPSITLIGPTMSKDQAEYCRAIEGGVHAHELNAMSLQSRMDAELKNFDNEVEKLQRQGLNKAAREMMVNRSRIYDSYQNQIAASNSNLANVVGQRANCK